MEVEGPQEGLRPQSRCQAEPGRAGDLASQALIQ